SGRRTGGGTIVGTAVPRAPSLSVRNPLSYSTFEVLRSAGIGWGFGGLGFAYDPFWSRGGFGYSRGLGWSSAAFGYTPDPFDSIGPTGGIRLNVEPRDAEVYVDGFYAGVVDNFDGHFQHLDLVPGPHHIEITAQGYEVLQINVAIQAHRK